MSTTAAPAAAAGPANPPSFGALSELLEHEPHAFALGAGSDALRLASEQALKDVFQIGRSASLLAAGCLLGLVSEAVAGARGANTQRITSAPSP